MKSIEHARLAILRFAGGMGDIASISKDSTASKIYEFGKDVQNGTTDSSGDLRCSPETVDLAILVHDAILALGFADTDAYRFTDGGIGITLYAGKNYLDIIVRPYGTLTVVLELGMQELWRKPRLDLSEAIKEIKNFILHHTPWTQFGSYVHLTSTNGRASSGDPRYAMSADLFLSRSPRALQKAGGVFVNT